VTAPTLPPTLATATEPARVSNPGPEHDGTGSRPEPARQIAGQYWHRWRLPLAVIAFIIVGGIAIALISRLATPPRPNSYLDPASTLPDGSHALTDVLAERGFTVVSTYSPAGALAALRNRPGSVTGESDAAASGQATLVITSPYLLTDPQRIELAQGHADLLIVEPGSEALAELAPAVLVQRTPEASFGRLLQPHCNLAAARLAGLANVGGYTYRAPAGGAGCYRVGGSGSLIQYRASGRTITILGAGTTMMNAGFGANGNAALVLNLLGANRRIVWLTPEPRGAMSAATTTHLARHGGPVLIPWAAWLMVIQLGISVVLVAGWRARRMGPLITERLPVVVRASETVEGHGRLYQSRRARGRAAAALRGAMLARMLPALGLVKEAPQEAVTAALTARSRRSGPEVSGIVYGPAPATDAELVKLARSLDELEREVRSQ
jgi:Domain of unknown function (DUF4350)